MSTEQLSSLRAHPRYVPPALCPAASGQATPATCPPSVHLTALRVADGSMKAKWVLFDAIQMTSTASQRSNAGPGSFTVSAPNLRAAGMRTHDWPPCARSTPTEWLRLGNPMDASARETLWSPPSQACAWPCEPPIASPCLSPTHSGASSPPYMRVGAELRPQSLEKPSG